MAQCVGFARAHVCVCLPACRLRTACRFLCLFRPHSLGQLQTEEDWGWREQKQEEGRGGDSAAAYQMEGRGVEVGVERTGGCMCGVGVCVCVSVSGRLEEGMVAHI